jgi:hypothetical protein
MPCCGPARGVGGDKLGWAPTIDAEEVALTPLRADVLVTADPEFHGGW